MLRMSFLAVWNSLYFGLDSWDCFYLLCPTFWYHLQSGRSVSGAQQTACTTAWHGGTPPSRSTRWERALRARVGTACRHGSGGRLWQLHCTAWQLTNSWFMRIKKSVTHVFSRLYSGFELGGQGKDEIVGLAVSKYSLGRH